MSKNNSAATAAKPAAATAVATQDPKSRALVAGGAIDFAADAGAGTEGTDKSSFAIPFITLLQGLSPQLETVEGAKPGMFYNTITGELYKEVFFVPCAFQRRYLCWAPRASGGGYRGEYDPAKVETGAVDGCADYNGTFMLNVPAGAAPFDAKGAPAYDHLSDTRNHFALVRHAAGEGYAPALFSLSSTQIKKSKRLMSRVLGLEMRRADGSPFNPPSFSHVYKAKAVKEENAKGSWWGWDFELAEPVSDAELYQKAKAFHASVASGEVKVQEPMQQDGTHAAGGTGDKF